MKKLLSILFILIVCSGCWSTKPIQRVKKDPIPVETEEQKEYERQALKAINQLIEKEESVKAVVLVSALQVKSGEPSSDVDLDTADLEKLGEKILQGVKDYRNKLSDWRQRYSSYLEFQGREKTTGEKIKTSLGWGLVILIVWAILAPSSLAVFAKWIHGRVKRAHESLEEEFNETKEQHDKLNKAAQYTFSKIEQIKAQDRDLWVQIKPYLNNPDDAEIESTIRKTLINTNTEALEKR